MGQIPDLTFYNGQEIPVIGLGTWQGAPGEVDRAVEEALKVGYRHFDCALLYGNEEVIGNVLKSAIDRGQVTRDELFVTTKLPPFANDPAKVRGAFQTSLDRLQIGYIDLYLIHLPVYFNAQEIQAQGMKSALETPPNPSAFFNKADHVGVWRELEKLVDEGLVKSIGISNFNQQQIQNVLDNARIKPASLQIECHVYLPQKELIEYSRKNNIIVTAYSPLGSPTSPFLASGAVGPVLLQDPVVKKIAEQHKRTPAQVLLQFLLQKGISVLPKSVKKERLVENFEALTFKLTSANTAELDKLGEKNIRYIHFSSWKASPDFPFGK